MSLLQLPSCQQSYKTKEIPYICIDRRETPTNNLQIKSYRFGV